MADNLPTPESRVESYLAKAAGEDVTIPEKPLSRTEQYLAAIAEGGGGGGGTSDFDQLTNRPKYNGTPMTGETNIPESTTYTAGDGIDIVADVIKATNTGKARVLTTDDYNYPTANPTGVALWLLEPGIYTWDRDLVVNANYDVNVSSYGYTTALVGGVSITDSELIVFGDSTNAPHTYVTAKSTGAPRGGSSILTAARIVDALNSTATGRPLSANQGRVLKDLIDSLAIRGAGAPTTSTVGEVGQLYEDGTNGALYQLKSIDITVTPNTYNWEEVGGGSGVTELTSADYNYPTDSPDGVAIWELDGGVYECAAGVKKYFSTTNSNEASGMVFVDADEPSSMFFSGYNNGLYLYRTNRSGVMVSGWPQTVLTNRAVVQTTGTSTADVMSQNAMTSMVYADPATRYRIAIGSSSSTIGTAGTAIGLNAQVSNGADGGVAIGVHARAGQKGEMNIGVNSSTDAPYYGYNGSQYRLLTGVYDPQSAHDAATKGYVDGKILSGAGAPTTSTTGTVGQVYQDTTNGKLYICTAIDTSVTPNTYTWTEVGAGGGGSVKVLSASDYNYPTNNPDGIALWLLEPGMYIQPSSAVYVYANNEGLLSSSVSGSFIVGNTKDGKKKILAFGAASDSTALLYSTAVSDGTKDYVRHLIDEDRIVQSTGTATDFVMSQNAVTSMVFQDPSNRGRIRIGGYASSGNEDGIAIGKVASLNAAKSIAIGASASATGQESIALGDGSSATQKGQMDIGAAGTTYGGYNNSNYRLLTGLYDGQSAHDAVNLGQLQNAIINGGTTAPTTTTVGAVGTQYTYVDTTGTPTAHLCVCTEIDTTDPSNPVYTWSTLI